MRETARRVPVGAQGENGGIGHSSCRVCRAHRICLLTGSRVAVFLASEDSSYITGQTIYPDGGRLALNYTVPVPET